MKCDRRLYLNRDKSRVVEEGDKDAAWLFATAGVEISPAAVSKYGLEVQGEKIVLPRPARSKAAKKSEDKAQKRSGDKSAEPPFPKPPPPPAPPEKKP